MKQVFLENFETIFDDIKPGDIKFETKLADIEDWSSLSALALIAMADQDYNVNLTGDDVRSFVTVEDVYHSIMKKKSE